MSFIRILFLFLLPPVAVYLQFGFGKHFAINVLLTLLGFFPGLLHGVIIMAGRYPGLAKRENFDKQLPETKGLTQTQR
jgi:uncharacterized membrane protein YqaE (UPF0057 family)